jgi:hypothetical protein
MDVCFSQIQLRVLGCMLEKEVTTPDQYPLTLNGLTTACNQKSNREPVMSLSESDVIDAISALKNKHFIQEVSGFGSRVTKYQHRFCNTEFSTFQFSDEQKALLCVLFLRGPQTAGELRTRTNRLCEFQDVKEAELALNSLVEHAKGPFCLRLAREPGKRDCRYVHLFGDVAIESERVEPMLISTPNSDRLEVVERELAALKLEIAVLSERLSALSGE